MIRLDSLDLTIDTGTLPPIDHDRFSQLDRTDPTTGEMRSAYTIGGEQTGLHGLNGIAWTDTAVSLRLTAQAMGDRYSDGISNATLPELCDRITDTGLISLCPDDLRDATVRRADPFADVLTDDAGDVPAALRLIGRTFGPSARTAGRGDGVTLYQKLPKGAGLLRGYPKGKQMQLAKHAEFRQQYPDAVAALHGHHRFELAARSYKASRSIASLDAGVPTVADVLDSARTPVADALDAMLSTWTGRRRALHSLPSIPDSLDAVLAMPSASYRDDATALLAALIADLTGGDYDAATEALRARYGSKNAARHYPAVRAACEAYRRPAEHAGHAKAVDVLRLVSDRVRDRESGQ